MKRKSILLSLMILASVLVLSGCWHPLLVEIEPSQTAFLIPLSGNTVQQGKFESEKFLLANQVASKRIMIPKEYIYGHGFKPTARVIVVERKPETREWTELPSEGTSTTNQGIVAESRESISFKVKINCASQIEEENTAKFLYRYNNKSLASVMDTEIRAMIESTFVEKCSRLPLDEILTSRGDILNYVRETVTPYFLERGITITTLGLKGDFYYINQQIQKSIDDKFKSAQEVITQKNLNEQVLSKAQADAEAVRLQAETLVKTIQLRELENQRNAIAKWNGQLPQLVGSPNAIFNLPLWK